MLDELKNKPRPLCDQDCAAFLLPLRVLSTALATGVVASDELTTHAGLGLTIDHLSNDR